MKEIFILITLVITVTMTAYQINNLKYQITLDMKKYERKLKELSVKVDSFKVKKIENKKETNSNVRKVLSSLIHSVNPGVDSYSLAGVFIDASKTYNIPLEILVSIAWQESHFNPNVISSSGCIGLMQINPRVWKFDKEILLNPALNINIGAGILRTYYNQTKSWKKAIIRYYGISDFAVKLYAPSVLRKIKLVKDHLSNEKDYENTI